MILEDQAEVRSPGEGSEEEREPRMDLGSYLQRGVQILQLDVEAVRAVHNDEDALLPALIFFAVAGLANGAGQFDFRVMVFGAILSTLLSFVLVGLLHVLARLFGSTASFLELYRPLGVAAPIHWVQAVPYLGPFLGVLAMLYFTVVATVVVGATGDLPRSKSIAVIAIFVGTSLFLCLVFLALVGWLVLFRAAFS